jgi:hypothetical protein
MQWQWNDRILAIIFFTLSKFVFGMMGADAPKLPDKRNAAAHKGRLCGGFNEWIILDYSFSKNLVMRDHRKGDAPVAGRSL